MNDTPQPKTTAPRIADARVHPWFDIEDWREAYGVEVLVNGRWLHLSISGKAAIFRTIEAAQESAANVMEQVNAL